MTTTTNHGGMTADNVRRSREALADAPALTHDLGPSARWGWGLFSENVPSSTLETMRQRQTRLAEYPSVAVQAFREVYDPHGGTPLPDASSLAHEMVSALRQQPAFDELAIAGASSFDVAGEAALDLADGLAKILKVDELPANAAASSPADVRAQVEDLQAFREGLTKQGHPAALDGRLDQRIDEAQGVLRRSHARREALAARLHEQVTGGSKAVASLVEKVAQRAQQHAAAIAAARLFGSGGGAGGNTTGGQPDPALVALLRDKPDLIKVFAMMGRMKQAASARVPDGEGKGTIEPDDIVAGNVLPRLLMKEKALLAHSATRAYQAMRAMQRQTLMRTRKGREPREGGDVVILLDRSGSMLGDRWEWCRGLGLAALLDARKAKRRVFLCAFTDAGREVTACVDFTKGPEADLTEAMNLLSLEVGGGTDTAEAVRHVARSIVGKGLQQADWLVITDGCWPDLSEKDLAAMKANGARLFVVLLEGSARIKGADRVWSLPTLSIEAAANVLQEVSLK